MDEWARLTTEAPYKMRMQRVVEYDRETGVTEARVTETEVSPGRVVTRSYTLSWWEETCPILSNFVTSTLYA